MRGIAMAPLFSRDLGHGRANTVGTKNAKRKILGGITRSGQEPSL